MSYPMKEYITDLETSATSAEPRRVALKCDAEGRCWNAYNQMLSAIKRANITAIAKNAMTHRNPYPAVFFGVGTGALIGYAIVWQLFIRRA